MSEVPMAPNTSIDVALSSAQSICSTNKSKTNSSISADNEPVAVYASTRVAHVSSVLMTGAAISPNDSYVSTSLTSGNVAMRPKPRPLELSINNCARNSDRYANVMMNSQCASEAIPTSEILDLIDHINRAVRANEFSAYLATQILRLVFFLKKYGLKLEDSYQNELNGAFVSLRQACCRDAGQLGTVCRMEMMELIELRAMGWQPNLSHSRYYLKRSCGSIAAASAPEANNGDCAKVVEADQFPAAPESAPPFGTVTINPFAFNLTNSGQIASTADLSTLHGGGAVTGPTPYFLIPASPITHNQAGIAFISPTSNVLAQSINANALAKAVYQTQPFSPQHSMTSSSSSSSTANATCAQKSAAKAPSKSSSRSLKTALKTACRAEIMIRNSDSGKVMGVKGRRVAVIEEMSNTIVSFHKVTPTCKDRMITINGPSDEAIKSAKSLIEETIRRNVSPDRIKTADEHGNFPFNAETCGSILEAEEEDNCIANANVKSEVEIMTGENGEMLKLISPNPKLLQTACKALDVYFRSQRNIATCDGNPDEQHSGGSTLKINRRKSFSSLVDTTYRRSLSKAFNLKKSTLFESGNEYCESSTLGIVKENRCAKSTPNLTNAETDFCSTKEAVDHLLSHSSVTSVEQTGAQGSKRYSRQEFIKIALNDGADDISVQRYPLEQNGQLIRQKPIEIERLLELLNAVCE